MPKNKNFQKRITILDECFASMSGAYTLDKLIYTVQEKLDIDVSRSTIQKDINFIIKIIENEFSNEIDFEANPVFIKKIFDEIDKKKKVFKYSNKKFALGNHLLSKSDQDQLEETLAILSRYRNRKDFFWLDELFPRIEASFNLVHEDYNSLISYQSNRDYSGQSWVGKLYNQLLRKKVLVIDYKGFNNVESYLRRVHPYHLKQYNDRWFLFGWQVSDNFTGITSLPLDRIIEITETIEDIKPDTTNWGDYFDEIVGVSRSFNSKPVQIKLRFSEGRFKYVTTKPICGSQRLDTSDLEGRTLFVDLIPNKELYQTFLSFGNDLEILEPKWMVAELNGIIKKMNEIYQHSGV